MTSELMKLKILMIQKGIRQRDIAKDTKISSTTVSRNLNGTRANRETINKIKEYVAAQPYLEI